MPVSSRHQRKGVGSLFLAYRAETVVVSCVLLVMLWGICLVPLPDAHPHATGYGGSAPVLSSSLVGMATPPLGTPQL